MDPVAAYIGIIDKLLATSLRWVSLRIAAIKIGPFEIELKGAAASSYEETLQKIGAAQSHLSQAVESIDFIKSEFSAEKTRLDHLLQQIRSKKEEYREAAGELATARDLLGKDKKKLRSALGLDERRGRVSGFVAGILASLIASFLWSKGPALLKVVTDYLATLSQGS